MSTKAKRRAARRARMERDGRVLARLQVRAAARAAVPLTCRAYSVAPDSLNLEARSVEAVLATEAPVEVYDWGTWQPVREVLLMAGCERPAQIPQQDSHNRARVADNIGSIRELRVEGENLVGRCYYTSAPEGEAAWTRVREGHLRDFSIGYRVLKATRIPAGESGVVLGRTFTAPRDMPLRVATRWRLVEGSLTAVGADDGAKARAAGGGAGGAEDSGDGTEVLAMDFEAWVKERGFELGTLSEAQRATLQRAWEAERAAAEPEAGDGGEAPAGVSEAEARRLAQEEVARAQAAEAARVSGIRAAAGDDVPAALVQECVGNPACTVEGARQRFLEHVRGARRGVAPAIVVRSGAAVSAAMLAAAVLLRALPGGGQAVVRRFGEEVTNRAEAYRSWSLVDMCRAALTLDGREVPAGRDEMIRAAFSTQSLPLILGETFKVSLLKGYQDAPQTWNRWCNIGTATDFKTMTRARLVDIGGFGAVREGGELPHGTVDEEGEQYKISTKGKKLILTRESIINDNVDILTRTPAQLGRRGALAVSQDVYTALLANAALADGLPLFVSGHRNLNTSSALSLTTFGTAVAAFRNQYDGDGEPIDVQPFALLVPPSLEATARAIVGSANIVLAGTTDAKLPAQNVWQGALPGGVIVESRLERSTYTGYSATTWYLVGNPAEVDTIEVSFLDGRQVPTVEEAPVDGLGIGWQAYLDYGVKALDFRGMVKSTA